MVHEVHHRHLPLERGQAHPPLEEEGGREGGRERDVVINQLDNPAYKPI